MSVEIYLTYIAACVLIAIIPGPSVSLIIANSLTHGTRAGLLNIAGGQLGLLAMLGVLTVGLAAVVEAMGVWFDWLRLAGAAYLVWIGWKLLRAPDALAEGTQAKPPRGGFFLQGLLVALSNPKMLLFFGAFIPQFVQPGGNQSAQVLLLGATALVVAALSDGMYAVLTGRAGKMLSRRRVRLVSRTGGVCLIGGGVWLALARAR
ncbi:MULTISPECIES: LysE family translocator [Inquilinus]|uniref:Threonine/homoserine/homoserine lactone efflux protein n=1 Tax=Inquilinus ginsengisoli TaxID=363840 RepID=A0ABU1JV94_9PROT|nr:LysE family translocator [Inquilinus ginsengisoli]MDR6292533.1 threonine/homoserine/homoserine lactone efflux protein [Inquilinus ginsengisoli]